MNSKKEIKAMSTRDLLLNAPLSHYNTELQDRFDAGELGITMKDIAEAWTIINVLNMAEMDRGESWPRANKFLSKWAVLVDDFKNEVKGIS